MILVDTSALYALRDRDDADHLTAREIWQRLLDADAPLTTHLYVAVETAASAQRRLGIAAVGALEDLLAITTLHPGSYELHRRGVASLLAAGRKDVSLVDRVRFLLMRKLRIGRAFAFDRHVAEQGFALERHHAR